MRYILLTFISMLLTTMALASNSCEELSLQIELNHQEIEAITIPDLTYSVDYENCSKVEPTLVAIKNLKPKLALLQSQYEGYYQSCDRSIDIIYAIEEVKINIILIGTLKDLAESLALQCESL